MRSNSTIQIRVFSVVKIQKKVEGRESRSRNQKSRKIVGLGIVNPYRHPYRSLFEPHFGLFCQTYTVVYTLYESYIITHLRMKG